MAPPGSAATPPLRGQVDDEEIRRASRHEGPGHGQRLVQGRRLEDHQPFEADPPGHRLHGIEAPGEVHVGDDRAGSLGLRRQPQGEGGLAARDIPPDGQPGPARDTTRTEDRVERGEARPDDPIVVRGTDRDAERVLLLVREGHRGQRPDDRAGVVGDQPPEPWRGLPPARPEGRQGRRHVRGMGRHRTSHDRTDVLSRQGARVPSPASPATLAGRSGPARPRSPRDPATGPDGAARRGTRRPPRPPRPVRTSWPARRSRPARPPARWRMR